MRDAGRIVLGLLAGGGCAVAKLVDQQQDFSGGMVCNVPPDRIPENAYYFGENWECRNGILRTRRGQRVIHAGFDPGDKGPYNPVGSCRIVSDSGVERVVVALLSAVDGSIRTVAVNPFLGDPGAFVEVSFPAGTQLTPVGAAPDDAVYLFQYGRFVYLARRNMENVWRMPVDVGVDPVWEAVPAADGGGTWMPRCSAACVAYGRIWAAVKSSEDDDVYDAVAASDIALLDATIKWDLVKRHWQIGADEHSDIIAMVPVGGGKIIVLKRHSVYALSGCEGYVEAAYAETVESNHGIVGGAAWAAVGGDVWYLSDDGVRSVAVGVSDNARAIDRPLTDSLGPWFKDNIVMSTTRRFACSAVVYDSYALFCVPYGHYEPNAVLAFDFVHECWVGVWTGIYAQQMQVMAYGVQRVLLGFSDNGAVQQILTVGRWGQADAPTANLITRSYNCGSTERRKSFRSGLIGVSSGGAVITLGAMDVDSREETIIKEDMSVWSEGWMIWIPDDGIDIPDEGIWLKEVGQQRRKFFVGVQSRAVSLTVCVESGEVDVRSVAVEGSAGRAMSEF